MNNFDKDFQQFHQNFQKQQRMAMWIAVPVAVASLAIMVGFCVVAAHFVAKVW